jgi:hypothetical protein
MFITRYNVVYDTLQYDDWANIYCTVYINRLPYKRLVE